jgi:hypothetical protein
MEKVSQFLKSCWGGETSGAVYDVEAVESYFDHYTCFDNKQERILQQLNIVNRNY